MSSGEESGMDLDSSVGWSVTHLTYAVHEEGDIIRSWVDFHGNGGTERIDPLSPISVHHLDHAVYAVTIAAASKDAIGEAVDAIRAYLAPAGGVKPTMRIRSAEEHVLVSVMEGNYADAGARLDNFLPFERRELRSVCNRLLREIDASDMRTWHAEQLEEQSK